MTLRVLVIDGNTEEADDRHVACGGARTAERHVRVLTQIRGDVVCRTVHPARRGGARLPADIDFADFDGVAWTGSSLNIYNDDPSIHNQIALSRAIFEAGVPQFGCCWGLQVAAVAAGGQVRRNPRGREFGIAKNITPVNGGETHPMLAGRRGSYEAIAIHLDEVVVMPPQSKRLAGNAMSDVQAAEIRYRAGTFWGVQYHPEYDLNEIAAAILRYGEALVDVRYFPDMQALRRCADDFRALHADPTRRDIIDRYGINEDILSPARRRTELQRWLECLVEPYAGKKGKG